MKKRNEPFYVSRFIWVLLFLVPIILTGGCNAATTPDNVLSFVGILHDDAIEIFDDPAYPGATIQVAERQLLIYYVDNSWPKLQKLINGSNSRIVGQIPDMKIIQLKVGEGVPLVEEQRYFEADACVIYARPNPLLDLHYWPEGEPNWRLSIKSVWESQNWHFNKVRAPEAWDICQGDQSVTVGIIDTGLDWNNYHDFDGRYIHNSDEPELKDLKGHGTAVAGVIGAAGNGSGTLGMAWNVKLHAYNSYNPETKVFCTDALFVVWKLINDEGNECKIINISGGDSPKASQIPVEMAAKFMAEFRFKCLPLYAYTADQDVVLIFGAGNDYSGYNFNDDIPVGHYTWVDKEYYCAQEWVTDYPTMDDFMDEYPNVLLIGATDGFDKYASFSDRGDVVILGAPGVDIYTSYSTDSQEVGENWWDLIFTSVDFDKKGCFFGGTSAAAPMVSGLAALVRSANHDLSAAQAVDIIIETAEKLELNPPIKRIDAYKAVKLAKEIEGQPQIPLNVNVGEDPDYPGYVMALISAILEFDEPVLDLGHDNFRLIEDGKEIFDYEVDLLNQGEISTNVDIAFIQDVSGSMGDEIEGVINSVSEFVDYLETANLDVRLGVVTFNSDIVPTSWMDLTDDVIEFKQFYEGLYAGGGTEKSIDAIMYAHGNFDWRLLSQRIYILITDEDIDVGQYTMAECLAAIYGSVVHAVCLDEGVADWNPKRLAESSGGKYMPLPSSGDFDLSGLPIGQLIGSAYVMRWKDTDPTLKTEHIVWIGAFRTPHDREIWKIWRAFNGTAFY